MVSIYVSKHNCLGPFANNPPTWIPTWTHRDTFEPPPNTHHENGKIDNGACGSLRKPSHMHYMSGRLSLARLTQNQTLGVSCLDGYSKSRPDSGEEHARTAEYRRTLQRLRVVIRTLNRDCTKYCVKYSVHYALLFCLHTAQIVSWSSRTWQKS